MGGSATVGVVRVQSIGLEGGEAVAHNHAANDAADVGEANTIPLIVKALDDLHRLGSVDSEISPPE
ncbi:MAG TPA: hypothetical protein VFE47_21585 [Tepidisphaeraceae bacterium]|nr:hypothetical protein [Tepidisphaeraceae bacterium]